MNNGYLELADCVLTNNGGNAGGDVYNNDSLAIYNSVLSNSVATSNLGGDGGAIFNSSSGVANISGSTFNNSTAQVNGGAIGNAGFLEIDTTTFNGNSAVVGAGINNTGTLNIVNDTLTGNYTQVNGIGGYQGSFGGGISNSGTLTASDCTLSANESYGEGGEIYSPSGTLNLVNTILANSVSLVNGTSISDLYYGGNTLGAFANNLIVSSNISGGSANIFGENPLLSVLGNYGGQTLTLALLPGSPALAAGNTSLIPNNPVTEAPYTTDQRGDSRLYAGKVDIGAFESQGFYLDWSGGNQSAPVNTPFANPIVVTVSSFDGEPVAGGQITLSTPATGASASLSATTITLSSSGQASVTATANGIAGQYNVAVNAGGSNTTAITLTNTASNVAPAVSQVDVLFGNGLTYNLANLTSTGRLDLPWAIKAIQVQFTEPVLGSSSSLAMTGLNGALGMASVSGSGTNTLTWTLATPITLDQVSGALATTGPSGITDLSGNALAAASSTFAFEVVLGDVTGDGKVTSSDTIAMRQLIAAHGYNIFFDLNGDGSVDSNDLSLLQGRIGTGF